jgi:hypothetical protein
LVSRHTTTERNRMKQPNRGTRFHSSALAGHASRSDATRAVPWGDVPRGSTPLSYGIPPNPLVLVPRARVPAASHCRVTKKSSYDARCVAAGRTNDHLVSSEHDHRVSRRVHTGSAPCPHPTTGPSMHPPVCCGAWSEAIGAIPSMEPSRAPRRAAPSALGAFFCDR